MINVGRMRNNKMILTKKAANSFQARLPMRHPFNDILEVPVSGLEPIVEN